MQNLPFLFQNLEAVGFRLGLPAPFFTLFSIAAAAAMGFTACTQPADLIQMEYGSLSLEISSSGFAGMQSLEPAAYLFSGIGPEGDTFSLTVSDSAASVEALKTGEWDVWVKGLNTNGDIILFGESSMTVESLEEVEVNIKLYPVEGSGSIRVTAEWPPEYTVDPSAKVTITNSAGETSAYSLVTGSDGFAEDEISELPTGNYRVTVQLFDSGVLVTGSAWTARILNNMTVEVSAKFNELNKVGEKIEIDEDWFTIAWDPDPEGEIPDAYRMYFRHRGEESWTFLSAVEAQTAPEFTVTRDNLSYGTYEFAVSSVIDGFESDLHTSMDDTADPVCGWYVDWLGA